MLNQNSQAANLIVVLGKNVFKNKARLKRRQQKQEHHKKSQMKVKMKGKNRFTYHGDPRNTTKQKVTVDETPI